MKRFLIACVMILLAGLIGFCAYRHYDTQILPEKRLEEAEKQQTELFGRIRPEISLPEAEQPESAAAEEKLPETDQSEPTTAEEKNFLAAAEDINSGVVGWIYIPDTKIDYPVAQAEDNDFYLHNGFDGIYNNELGCPFLDYRCEADFSGFNSIVYAHNMEGRAMFADVALYQQEEFMQNHPKGYLILADEIHTVDFFAYLSVPSNDAVYHTVFITDTERQEYLSYLEHCAKYLQNPDADADSHLLLLSTCTFEYDDARGILAGVIR